MALAGKPAGRAHCCQLFLRCIGGAHPPTQVVMYRHHTGLISKLLPCHRLRYTLAEMPR